MNSQTIANRLWAIIGVLLLSALLSSCGKEGPFGNTPGPKKPSQLSFPALGLG
jgi:hypothetical protein